MPENNEVSNGSKSDESNVTCISTAAAPPVVTSEESATSEEVIEDHDSIKKRTSSPKAVPAPLCEIKLYPLPPRISPIPDSPPMSPAQHTDEPMSIVSQGDSISEEQKRSRLSLSSTEDTSKDFFSSSEDKAPGTQNKASTFPIKQSTFVSALLDATCTGKLCNDYASEDSQMAQALVESIFSSLEDAKKRKKLDIGKKARNYQNQSQLEARSSGWSPQRPSSEGNSYSGKPHCSSPGTGSSHSRKRHYAEASPSKKGFTHLPDDDPLSHLKRFDTKSGLSRTTECHSHSSEPGPSNSRKRYHVDTNSPPSRKRVYSHSSQFDLSSDSGRLCDSEAGPTLSKKRKNSDADSSPSGEHSNLGAKSSEGLSSHSGKRRHLERRESSQNIEADQSHTKSSKLTKLSEVECQKNPGSSSVSTTSLHPEILRPSLAEPSKLVLASKASSENPTAPGFSESLPPPSHLGVSHIAPDYVAPGDYRSPLTESAHIRRINKLTNLIEQIISIKNLMSARPLISIPGQSSSATPQEITSVAGPSNRPTLRELEEDFERAIRAINNNEDNQEEVNKVQTFRTCIRDLKYYLEIWNDNMYKVINPDDEQPYTDRPTTRAEIRSYLPKYRESALFNLGLLQQWSTMLLYWSINRTPQVNPQEFYNIQNALTSVQNHFLALRCSMSRLMSRWNSRRMDFPELADLTSLMAIDYNTGSLFNALLCEVLLIQVALGTEAPAPDYTTFDF